MFPGFDAYRAFPGSYGGLGTCRVVSNDDKGEVRMDENESPRFDLRVPILPIVPALAITLVLAALVWAVTWPSDPQPDCPTEDSCGVDYHGDKWHIEEVTP